MPTGRRKAPPDDKLRNPGEGDSPRTHFVTEICGSSPSPQPSPREVRGEGEVTAALQPKVIEHEPGKECAFPDIGSRAGN